MKELTIVSGKGGAGKTSVAASFAALARDKAIADCDVDAADLHLVMEPTIKHREPFSGGSKAEIDLKICSSCGLCRTLCRFDAIDKDYKIDDFACEGCGVCADNCPEKAALLIPRQAGELFVSDTRNGPMVHARLIPGEENSGKLVSLVRSRAREIAENEKLGLVLIDGSPGIGCPVIASVTGVSLLLIVTEPTLSGLHDLDRIASLAGHFGIPSAVCVNKFDINIEMTESIEKYCAGKKLPIVGRIPYDTLVTKAQIAGVSVVEYSGGAAALEVSRVWKKTNYMLETC
ncbi:MAG TPA: ATP-binding protein [bacterium]|nr:ATP-binding protein [bacterium]